MENYKVGDRVRVIKTAGNCFSKNEVVDVKDVSPNSLTCVRLGDHKYIQVLSIGDVEEEFVVGKTYEDTRGVRYTLESKTSYLTFNAVYTDGSKGPRRYKYPDVEYSILLNDFIPISNEDKSVSSWLMKETEKQRTKTIDRGFIAAMEAARIMCSDEWDADEWSTGSPILRHGINYSAQGVHGGYIPDGYSPGGSILQTSIKQGELATASKKDNDYPSPEVLKRKRIKRSKLVITNK